MIRVHNPQTRNMAPAAGRIALALAIFVLFSSGSASAQNLVANPHFDTNASSWFLNAPGAFDATQDANGSPSSGSVGAAYGAATITSVPVFQCISGVVAGNSYSFGAQALIAQASAGGQVTIRVDWYTDTACSSNNGLALTPILNTLDAWTPASASAIAPAGTQSATIAAFVGTGAAAIIHVDDFFFQSNAVPSLDTTWLITLALCLLGVASATLLRRNGFAGAQHP
jgi:hypothetical protein